MIKTVNLTYTIESNLDFKELYEHFNTVSRKIIREQQESPVVPDVQLLKCEINKIEDVAEIEVSV